MADEGLILATKNSHKLREFQRLLPEITLRAMPEDISLPPEDGNSYDENALEKARAVAHITMTPVLADDSGIEASELDGAPGIRSARYAGEGASDRENLDKLIREVSAGSKLRYVCALAYVSPSGEEQLFDGHCDGTRAESPRGEKGFGYDPIFLPDDQPESTASEPRTMAQLTDQEKDAISHRGDAARRFLVWLEQNRGD
jgi:XTP/dITP diphosphohydrolase